MWTVKANIKKTIDVPENKISNLRLGDKVHAVAQPIAEVIDRVTGARISTCGACAKRREKLNNLFNKDT